jgi:hypothetical protein
MNDSAGTAKKPSGMGKKVVWGSPPVNAPFEQSLPKQQLLQMELKML